MQLYTQSVESRSMLKHDGWGTTIIGDSVDERGEAAIAFAKSVSGDAIPMRFIPSPEMVVEVGSSQCSPDAIDAYVASLSGTTILIEATTLGLVETFLLCKAAKGCGLRGISLLYTEPMNYRGPNSEPMNYGRTNLREVLRRRDFELSDEVESFSGIPGAALLLRPTDTRLVFLLGYEGQRLEQALEQTGIRPSQCCVVFGVPAFQPGWEMDSFANNVRVIRERSIDEIMYAAAHSPAGAYDVLDKAFKSRLTGERFLISPIGTKPHAIGAALFACEHEDVGLLYDHPVRSRGRSRDVAMWHLYDVVF